MFKNLTHFQTVRIGWEPFGFYIAWLLIIVLVGAMLGGIAALLIPAWSPTSTMAFDHGVTIGSYVAVIICTVIATLICRVKHLSGFKYLSLIFSTLILSALGGGVLGLIIPAYLTTQKVYGTLLDSEEKAVI